MKKSLIAAGAASVALAAMPVVGVFAVDPTDSITDTITVSIETSCTFKSGKPGATYAFTGTNGAAATTAGSNQHAFTAFCNNNSGYTVSATATALNQNPTIDANFAYKGGDNPTLSGDNGLWHAQFASSDVTVAQIADGETSVDIYNKPAASASAGESFTATYSVYVGGMTPSGTYQGTIAYTLTPGA